MTKIIAATLITVFTLSAQANEMFSACEHVSDMAVLAKDNIPFWTANRNSKVTSCYADIKEFITAASAEHVQQFNSEYDGQIIIFSNDLDFAKHIASKKTESLTFAIPIPINKSLTPVIRPNAPAFFTK